MAELINRPQYLNQLIQNKDVDLVNCHWYSTLRKIVLAGFVSSLSVRARCAGFSDHSHEYGISALP